MKLWVFSHPLQHRCEKEQESVSQEVEMAPFEDSDYQLESQMSDEKNASEKYQESMSQEVKMAPVQHQYVFTEKEIIMSFQPPWRPW